MIRVFMSGSRGVVVPHRNSLTAVAVVAMTVGIFAIRHRTHAMATTTVTTPHLKLSESIQQSLPQLYDTPLKRIMDYTTDPITNSVTAHIDTDDNHSSLRSVVREQTSQQQLPSVCFVIRRPG